ncbi:MAG: 3-hydroxyacyl-CoA dehydrogenase NAD-binding domain-containing protein, partial [Thermomicrobiales bacterium]
MPETRKVAVIGSGTMGPGMAATFARNGFETSIYDIKQEQLDKAKGAVDFVYTTLTNGGFMTAEDADAGRSRITYTTDLAGAVEGAEFVVETVPERREIKQQVYQEIESLGGDLLVIATKNSGHP